MTTLASLEEVRAKLTEVRDTLELVREKSPEADIAYLYAGAVVNVIEVLADLADTESGVDGMISVGDAGNLIMGAIEQALTQESTT